MAKILIIEDDIPLQEAYAFTMQSDGHHVDTASNGREGLDLATANHYDVILLDLQMPIMSGMEFLDEYSKEHKSATSIILFSNMIDRKVEIEATKSGADRCILKSTMTPGDMLDLIKEITIT